MPPKKDTKKFKVIVTEESLDKIVFDEQEHKVH